MLKCIVKLLKKKKPKPPQIGSNGFYNQKSPKIKK